MAVIPTTENNHDLMVEALAYFTQNELYPTFRDYLRMEREELLNEGKKKRDAHYLSMLEGFDRAATIFERCAAKVRADNADEESNDDSDD
jgi:hypothetical protein